MPPEKYRTSSLAGTLRLGRKLAARLAIGDCVGLVGALGAGKTALVRGIASGLGLADQRMVSSPTFVLVQEYPGRMPVFHLDLYRMSYPRAELADLGLDEMLGQGIVLVEWADRAADVLPNRRWRIDIEITGRKSRTFSVQPPQSGPKPAGRKRANRI
ncbi:MAG: tRNA (adenosine(37)-N6)-threonylcarbamoyltransferase complex ATPase subunit type 1 TsaE [Planctomycetes bacterium]|nr:tRNA (adenosine(37)-N6)-threonylcarbamoyltransferase complex ATPase subunit type 1 TsaE [Planctomycetota bacterium]